MFSESMRSLKNNIVKNKEGYECKNLHSKQPHALRKLFLSINFNGLSEDFRNTAKDKEIRDAEATITNLPTHSFGNG